MGELLQFRTSHSGTKVPKSAGRIILGATGATLKLFPEPKNNTDDITSEQNAEVFRFPSNNLSPDDKNTEQLNSANDRYGSIKSLVVNLQSQFASLKLKANTTKMEASELSNFLKMWLETYRAYAEDLVVIYENEPFHNRNRAKIVLTYKQNLNESLPQPVQA